MTDFNKSDLKKFKELLNNSNEIVITCHVCPDGDAICSCLGLKKLIRNINSNASITIITPDEPTATLSFLPDFRNIVAYSHHPQKVANKIKNASLIICLDFNELGRTDLVAPLLLNSDALKILIDHHVHPGDFAELTFSYPDKSSTCMLLFLLLEAASLDYGLDKDVATCLLAGMMTDTGDFSYNVSDLEIYRVIARLIEFGADKARLTRLLFNTNTESCLRIQGYALSSKLEIFDDFHSTLITLSQEELNRFHYKKGDTEGLVNTPLSIPGILISCFLREETDFIKVSMRSLSNIPVNEICSIYFGGGGHINAAGGEFKGSMEDCAQIFKNILSEINNKYIENQLEVQKILKEELSLHGK